MTLDDIIQPSWQPKEVAVLCFILHEDKKQILLIHKKRGLGAGKINGPGGRLENGETPLEAAIRETREEVGVTPLDPAETGICHFQFIDGYSLRCHIFLAKSFEGELIETDEAIPLWNPIDSIPYEKMWQDDKYWFPALLEEKRFEAWFVFDDEAMLEKKVLIENS